MANWTDEEVEQVWNKASEVPGYDKNVYRKDQCGAWIQKDEYGAASVGESHTSFKWQVDHIKPDSKGGADVLSNARPLQWYNNDCRQNGRLMTKVTAEDNHNIEITDK